MKPQNVKEAIALIKRYREISLEEIKEVWDYEFRGFPDDYDEANMDGDIAFELTGFNSEKKCILCRSIHHMHSIPQCSKCIYQVKFGCSEGEHKETFEAIENAKTPRELYKAINHRADHIEQLIFKWV